MAFDPITISVFHFYFRKEKKKRRTLRISIYDLMNPGWYGVLMFE